MAGKVSDGKSVVVTAPVGGMTNGKFYEVSGFLGCAFKTVAVGEETALNIAQEEFETSQIDTALAYNVGDMLYWDGANSRFTSDSGVIGARLAGIVTNGKDANNVIWFILGPQV